MAFDDWFLVVINKINEAFGPKLVLRVAGVSLLLAFLLLLFGQTEAAFLFAGFTLAVFWGYEYAYALQGEDYEGE